MGKGPARLWVLEVVKGLGSRGRVEDGWTGSCLHPARGQAAALAECLGARHALSRGWGGRGFFEEKRLGNLSVGRRVVPGGPWSLNPSRVGEPSKKRGHKAGGVNGPCPNAVWGGDRSSFVRATMWMPDKWTLYKGSCEVSLHGKPAPDNLFLWPLLRGCFCECRSPLSLSP